MIIHVLFAQRKESYDGEYAPEAVDVVDEYAFSDNPEYLEGRLSEFKSSAEYQNAEIVDIDLGRGAQRDIRDKLIGRLVLGGEVL
ncbi:hypothetical protein [Pseudoalteromonas phage PH357]|nr:hypothetical protein [Pseudoalteromonas phage PH357]